MNKLFFKILILFVQFTFFSLSLFAFNLPNNKDSAYYTANFVYSDYDGPPSFSKYAFTIFKYVTFQKENGILYCFDINSDFDFLSCYIMSLYDLRSRVNKEASCEKDVIEKSSYSRLGAKYKFLRYDNIHNVHVLFGVYNAFQVKPIALGIESAENKMDFIFSKSDSVHVFDKNGEADVSVYNISDNYLYTANAHSKYLQTVYSNYFLRKIDTKLTPEIIDKISILSAAWLGCVSREKRAISREDFLKIYHSTDFSSSDISKNVALVRDFINNLSAKWKFKIFKKGEVSSSFEVSAVSKYSHSLTFQFPEKRITMDDKLVNLMSMRFVASNFNDEIYLMDHDVYLNEKNSVITAEVKSPYLLSAKISDFKNNPKLIIWKRISCKPENIVERLKWEISSDFTEIKEYVKDGERWKLQTVMTKQKDK